MEENYKKVTPTERWPNEEGRYLVLSKDDRLEVLPFRFSPEIKDLWIKEVNVWLDFERTE